MTANRIIELMNRLPFQSLEIHLNNGTIISVDNPYDIAARPNSPDITIYEEDRWRFVACRNITEVTTPSLNGQ